MLDVRDLYQEVIIDHNRHPRNYQVMAEPSCQADGYNRLCGDKIRLFLQIENDKIVAASFQGVGCAISTASASLMTEILKGKTLSQAQDLFQCFHQAMTTENHIAENNLGKLTVLLGVKEYPARVKCATLAWHTLQAALENSEITATTE